MSSDLGMALSCSPTDVSLPRMRRKLLPVLAIAEESPAKNPLLPDPWENCADLAKEDLEEFVRSSRPGSREGSMGSAHSSSVGNTSPAFGTAPESPQPAGALWLSSYQGKFGARDSLGATSRDSLGAASTAWAGSCPGTSSLGSTARPSLQPSGSSTPKAESFAAGSIQGSGVSTPVCNGRVAERLAPSVRRGIMSAVFAEKGAGVEMPENVSPAKSRPNVSRLVPVMLVEADV